ncbi:MAG: mevalonate kinase family protein [Ilumatobacteraceae bacterium]
MAEALIIERVPARAALAGNPSDGYGGAVLAAPVRSVGATITLRHSDGFEIAGRRFGTWNDVIAPPAADAPITQPELVQAAIRAYAAIVSPDPYEPCAIDVDTTIPRSVGLAGSSAIIIATLRSIARHAAHPALAPDELAVVALAAEVEQLGITAGLQDRLVQSAEEVIHMEFGSSSVPALFGRPAARYQIVAASLAPHLFVAHRRAAAASSDATHRPLRDRFDTGDADVITAMATLAGEARAATTALEAGDVSALGSAMNRSFDLRRSVVPLNPAHVEMVDRARLAGAAANYSGSGGAVTVLAPDDAVATHARSALAEIGCEILPLGT